MYPLLHKRYFQMRPPSSLYVLAHKYLHPPFKKKNLGLDVTYSSIINLDKCRMCHIQY